MTFNFYVWLEEYGYCCFSQLLEEAKNAEQVSKATEEKYMAKDHELEKLKRENRELTAAYNDLNEEFENHRAEHGSVVTSNRDLTMRIGFPVLIASIYACLLIC